MEAASPWGLRERRPKTHPGEWKAGRESGVGTDAPGNMGENQPLCVLILQHLRQPQANVMVLRCHFALIRVKLQYATCFAHLLIQRMFLSA